MKTKLIVAIAIVVSAALQSANALAHDTDLQSWTVLSATGSISKEQNLRWYLEVQPRIGHNANELERLLVRSAVSYGAQPGLSLWLGHGWTPLFVDANFDTEFRDEHRIWEQLQYEDKQDLITTTWRLRQEQRMIEDLERVAHRTRFLIRASSTDPIVGDFGLTAYNEFFVNMNQPLDSQMSGFDRDRVFVGPYRQFGPARFELGLLGEFAKRPNTEPRRIVALVLGLSYKFD